MDTVTLDDVYKARERLFIRHSLRGEVIPKALSYVEYDRLVGLPGFSWNLGSDVYMACETASQSKSFKWHGAANKMLSLLEQQENFTPITASAGNHAQGVAMIMNELGKDGTLGKMHIGKAKIYMPTTTPKVKVEAVKKLGGNYVDTVLTGNTFDEASAAAEKEVASHPDCISIPPFNDRDVIAGQGIVALDIIEELAGVLPNPKRTREELHALVRREGLDKRPIEVYVPCGGGGLVSGIATVFREFLPHAKIIAVEPSYAASATAAMKKGRPVMLDPPPQRIKEMPIASGITVQRIGDLPLRIMNEKQVHTVAVNDRQIKYTTNMLCQTARRESQANQEPVYPEESGAAAMAAMLNDFKLHPRRQPASPKPIKICVLSGANIDRSVVNDLEKRFGTIENAARYTPDFIRNFPALPTKSYSPCL